ncbi:hypothetical protein HRU87_02255 [Aquiluna borgnonia]|uniref:UDP-2,4-diacetamido-2,4, 6-trideoxy-beta-L-altropyranose hydrolase n=1 Tax=Aquiluna borgnonia TaxID=2499157 RepID=A0A7D4PX01_9MICO|nr:hypothetical protein [Aquiluna borgnonia]QKJ25044.1 hypothetical protein HRU87_02255 [Aquiluna borgnonia]
MTGRDLIIIASSNSQIGGGHLSRQLVLADEALRRGWEVSLIGHMRAHEMTLLRGRGIEYFAVSDHRSLAEHLIAIQSISQKIRNGILVIDNYELLEPFTQMRDELGLPQVHFEDGGGFENLADVIVNSGLSNSENFEIANIPSERCSFSIVGPQAAMIRSDLKTIKKARRLISDNPHDLLGYVNFGLSNKRKLLNIIFSQLESLNNFGWTVVEGIPDSNLKRVCRSEGGGKRATVPMKRVMLSADFAIGGGGLSAYERAYVGIPSVTVVLSDNQRGIAKILQQAGAAITLDTRWTTESDLLAGALEQLGDPEIRAQMSQAGKTAVDGLGAGRVMNQIERL